MARQAEAERERRATVIQADVEYWRPHVSETRQTSSGQTQPRQLGYLQTLTEVGNDETSTIVFAPPSM